MRGAAAALVLLAAAVRAGPPDIHQRITSETADLARDVERTNKVCQSSLRATIDWSSAPSDALTHYSAEGYCNAALEAIERVCVDQLGKDAIKKQVRNLACGFGASRQARLRNGTLDYEINFNSTNDADYVFEYLQNQL